MQSLDTTASAESSSGYLAKDDYISLAERHCRSFQCQDGPGWPFRSKDKDRLKSETPSLSRTIYPNKHTNTKPITRAESSSSETKPSNPLPTRSALTGRRHVYPFDTKSNTARSEYNPSRSKWTEANPCSANDSRSISIYKPASPSKNAINDRPSVASSSGKRYSSSNSPKPSFTADPRASSNSFDHPMQTYSDPSFNASPSSTSNVGSFTPSNEQFSNPLPSSSLNQNNQFSPTYSTDYSSSRTTTFSAKESPNPDLGVITIVGLVFSVIVLFVSMALRKKARCRREIEVGQTASEDGLEDRIAGQHPEVMPEYYHYPRASQYDLEEGYDFDGPDYVDARYNYSGRTLSGQLPAPSGQFMQNHTLFELPPPSYNDVMQQQ